MTGVWALGIQDGTEDANRDGTRQGNETDPLARDTDGDFVGDYDEVMGTWCYSGEVPGASCGSETTARKLNATVVDTDGDGIADGVEAQAEGAVLAVGLAVGFAYTGPKARTDPKVGDSDGDGLSDGMEDANRNGRVEGNETTGDAWDSDRDGLCDGNCSAKGEDLNANGFRDQDDDGN